MSWLLKIVKSFKLACFGLWANRFRVFLAMTGIVIGVFSIIVLTSIAIGVKETVVKQMGGLGAEQMMVVPGRVLKNEQGQHNFLNGMSNVSSTLTYADAEKVAKLANVKAVTPHLETVSRVQYDLNGESRLTEAMLVGTSDTYQNVMKIKVKEGRFFTKEEEVQEERVVVLGDNIEAGLLKKQVTTPKSESSDLNESNPPLWKRVIEWLFGEEVFANSADTIIGGNVLINGESYRVIGVLESKATLGVTTNNSVIIPITTALSSTNMKNLTNIYIEVSDRQFMDTVEREAHQAIRSLHSEADFSIVKQTEMLKAIDKVTTILQVMLFGITVIALLISGSGIMNVMVMSVRERTREIGIRKALGATTIEILYQFFFETILLCFVGGLAGLALGYAVIQLWNANISAFSLVLPLWAIKLAIYSSLGIGCICGIYPAYKAARMQPSEALRYE